MSHRAWGTLIFLAACGRPSGPAPSAAGEPPASAARATGAAGSVGSAANPAAPAASAAPAVGCDRLPFADTTPVPEASGAGWLTVDGKLVLVVVSDSGNRGAYGLVDPDTGATLETGQLPLTDQASDDLEGVAVRDGKLYGLTSSGWVRVWRRVGRGFALEAGPYALGPVDLPDTKNNDRAPAGDGMVCNPRVVNCGRNYEGLCLAPAPRDPRCIGLAASKADGHLYCLSEDRGQLVVHHELAIAITHPGALADCAFSDDGTLWVGSNLFDLARVYRVRGWDAPASAQIETVGSYGVGFPELIAARGDILYRMSDTGGAPSAMARYRCAGAR